MTKLEIKGDLNIIKGKLKQKQAKVTDNKLQGAKITHNPQTLFHVCALL